MFRLESSTKLTKRECQVYDLVVSGMTNKQAAEKLDVSRHVIRFHLGNIFKKTKCDTRYQLAAKHHQQKYEVAQ